MQHYNKSFYLLLCLILQVSCASNSSLKRGHTGHNSVQAFSFSRHQETQLPQFNKEPIALCGQGKFSEAYAILNQKTNLSAAEFNGLGVCGLLEKKPELAFYYLRRGMNLVEKKHDPHLKAMLLNNLGLLFLAQGRAQDAYEYFENSYKEMSNPVAAINISGLAVEFAHFKHALSYLSMLDQKDQEVLALKVRAHIGLGQIQQGLNLFKNLHVSYQEREDVAFTVAAVLKEKGEAQKALELMEKRRPLAFNHNDKRADKLLGQLESMIEQLAAVEEAKLDLAKERQPAQTTTAKQVRNDESLAQKRAPKTRER
jgi:tetratricopeptide (TPR) repeat protein